MQILKCEKVANKKLMSKKWRNFKFALFSITNLLKFSANNFFQVHLFLITLTDVKCA
jgi:hypothetical protein